jgi:hypothetical protein
MRSLIVLFSLALAACGDEERILLGPTAQLTTTARATAEGRVVLATGEGVSGALVLIDVLGTPDLRGAYLGDTEYADREGRFSLTLERTSATPPGVAVDTVTARVVWRIPPLQTTPGQIDTIVVRFSPVGVPPTPTTHELRWRGGQVGN